MNGKTRKMALNACEHHGCSWIPSWTRFYVTTHFVTHSLDFISYLDVLSMTHLCIAIQMHCTDTANTSTHAICMHEL